MQAKSRWMLVAVLVVTAAVRPGPTDRLLLYPDGLMEAPVSDGRQFELGGQVEAVLAVSSLAPRWRGWLAGCWSMPGPAWTMTWRWCWRGLAC